METTINEKEIVRLSTIHPKKIRSFFKGYVEENANESPYDCFGDLEFLYPGFKKWFYETVIPGLNKPNPDREIIFLMSPDDECCEFAKVAGFAILKKTIDERKICSFRISAGYRDAGYGETLMCSCFDYLETTTPLISISDNYKKMFEGLLDKYHFKLTQTLEEHYRPGISEYVFNGYLKNAKVILR